MLVCHAAHAENRSRNAVSPLAMKLRHAKTVIGAVTPVPPSAAQALVAVYASEFKERESKARCLQLYSKALMDDQSGCVQLFQYWGINDLLVWRVRREASQTSLDSA